MKQRKVSRCDLSLLSIKYSLFSQSFIQQIFLEHLLYVRSYFKSGKQNRQGLWYPEAYVLVGEDRDWMYTQTCSAEKCNKLVCWAVAKQPLGRWTVWKSPCAELLSKLRSEWQHLWKSILGRKNRYYIFLGYSSVNGRNMTGFTQN